MCVLGGLLLTALLVLCVADKESKPAKRHPNRGQYLKGAWVTCTFTLADVILQTSVIKNLVWLDFGLMQKWTITWINLGSGEHVSPFSSRFWLFRDKKTLQKGQGIHCLLPYDRWQRWQPLHDLELVEWKKMDRWVDGEQIKKKKKKTFSKLINTEKSLLLQSVYTSKYSDPQ